MNKIAICYSFNTNKTSLAAKKIAEEFGQEQVELVNAENITTGRSSYHIKNTYWAYPHGLTVNSPITGMSLFLHWRTLI